MLVFNTMTTVVVTRHAALVEYLIKAGVITAETPVLSHATADDVRGKHVIGVLPLHLAAEAAMVSEVKMDIPAEMRGKELSLKDMVLYVRGMFTYSTKRLSEERFPPVMAY